jgi:hypothetical protein
MANYANEWHYKGKIGKKMEIRIAFSVQSMFIQGKNWQDMPNI